MSDSPRIVLWRHGQTDWNIQNRFQGHSDIPLNKVGEYQAAHAAKILAAMTPSKIIASDLMRAKQTAAKLSELLDLPVAIDPDLRETNGGNWEGKTGEQNREEDHERFTGWLSGADVRAGEIGESRTEVATRVVRAIESAMKNESGTVVFVTHGGAARCALGKLLGIAYPQWAALGGLSNACWSVLERDRNDRWTLAEHNAGSIPEPVFGNETGA